MKFQSTSPARGTTAKRIPRFFWRLNFNPRPPCGGRLRRYRLRHAVKVISIHVPRAGDDRVDKRHDKQYDLFQSTSPVRGTTFGKCPFFRRNFNFNPRPPCGGRHFRIVKIPL